MGNSILGVLTPKLVARADGAFLVKSAEPLPAYVEPDRRLSARLGAEGAGPGVPRRAHGEPHLAHAHLCADARSASRASPRAYLDFDLGPPAPDRHPQRRRHRPRADRPRGDAGDRRPLLPDFAALFARLERPCEAALRLLAADARPRLRQRRRRLRGGALDAVAGPEVVRVAARGAEAAKALPPSPIFSPPASSDAVRGERACRRSRHDRQVPAHLRLHRPAPRR